MSCNSAIYTVNQTGQEISTDAGTFVQVPFGSVIRRFGRNLQLDGGMINCCDSGYFDVDCSLLVTPTAAGEITVQLRQNGVVVPGMTRTLTGTAATPLALDIPNGLVRNCGCNCNSMLSVWIDAPCTINSMTGKVEKI